MAVRTDTAQSSFLALPGGRMTSATTKGLCGLWAGAFLKKILNCPVKIYAENGVLSRATKPFIPEGGKKLSLPLKNLWLWLCMEMTLRMNRLKASPGSPLQPAPSSLLGVARANRKKDFWNYWQGGPENGSGKKWET